jgi:hypothetical protein
VLAADLQYNKAVLAADLQYNKAVLAADFQYNKAVLAADFQYTKAVLAADLQNNKAPLEADLQYTKAVLEFDVQYNKTQNRLNFLASPIGVMLHMLLTRGAYNINKTSAISVHFVRLSTFNNSAHISWFLSKAYTGEL